MQFSLLTDWADAPQEHTPDDADLLAAAKEGIDRLNDRYGPGPEKSIRFFIFHRKRLWNAQEGVWMGWERKRGKLHELNRLLRGDIRTSFLLDFLNHAQEENVVIEILRPDAPVVFKLEKKDNYLHIIMPVRIQE